MTEHHFETLGPIHLYVELGKGSVKVRAADTTESRVEVAGRDAAEVLVQQDGDQLSVIAPRHRTGFLGGESAVHVVATIPEGSHLVVKTGSADITGEGNLGTCRIKSGSGEVLLDSIDASTVETGSGDIRVAAATAGLRIKSGSGDVAITRADDAVSVSTGSGDIEVGSSAGTTVVKTGSGDLKVSQATGDVSLSTGSGDLVIGAATRGRYTVKGASGDVRIGIPAGVPVWTDISTITGRIHSTVQGAGQPEEGADHVEVRATTVSGDILLDQL